MQGILWSFWDAMTTMFSFYVPQVRQMSGSPFSSRPSAGVFESLFQWLCPPRDWGHPNAKLSSKPSCSGRPELAFSVDSPRRDAVSECTGGILACLSRFSSSVSSWGKRFPSRWSLLRITCEWCGLLLFVDRAPLHVGHEILAKLLEGIWTTPQLAHSASTALP